ncbi:hypothetical protein SAMN02746041_00057 [Desulfacinum hydrothermale DSM 13146]|uniref:Flagellar Assembly Protein A N-terminal region domain-containing protein n=1 Tax=Desulfacinum hydrothermale DSM 13146 TaxID=1121390 RepID=A0A1W1WXD2_9BACT|nr:FapA family protein [Desulfacinum hydrothermale]SMC16382.1 hypothetical protein SAMN02746041_00057 [Desulfacinum hydrothermale DSM 13146]
MPLYEKIGDRDQALLLGKLAIKYGLASPEQVREALGRQKRLAAEGTRRPLGDILMEMGVLTPSQCQALIQIQQFLAFRQKERPFLDYAVSKGYLLPKDEKLALKKQMERFRKERRVLPIGQILVQEEILDPSALAQLEQEFLGTVSPAVSPEEEKEAPPEQEGPAGVSPSVIEELEEFFEVRITQDKLEAVLVWSKRPEVSLDQSGLEALLHSRGIRAGIVDLSAVVETVQGQRTPKGSITIARGRPPKPGRNASIRYFFETDPLQVGRIKEGGAIDFRDRGRIPQVEEGTLLAEKIPPQPGTPGQDVFGNPVPPPKPMDVILRCGGGAVRSEDGTQVFAKTSGRPLVTADGKISVYPDLEIPGDVDLSTGHVVFDGHVHISGTVTTGFRVQAASVSANEVHHGEIEATGHVVIVGGIIGGRVTAGGPIKARHAMGSRIRAAGDVVVESSVVDSVIETSGACYAGDVLSSDITAFEGIEALNAGSEKSRGCRLTIGHDPLSEEKLKHLRGLLEGLKKRSERLQRAESRLRQTLGKVELQMGAVVQRQDKMNGELRQLEAMLQANPDPALEEEKRGLQEQMVEAEAVVEQLFGTMEGVKEKIKELRQKRNELHRQHEGYREEYQHLVEWMKARPRTASIKVRGQIAAGSIVQSPTCQWKLPETLGRCLIREKPVKDAARGVTVRKLVPLPLEE